MDAWDFIDPVDILPKLPIDFRENIESKKWVERKEALDELLKLLTENTKLNPNVDYKDIVKLLKNILHKDVNINVASLAAKCLTQMARGLRQKFSIFSNDIIGVVTDKFKEKKKVLLDELVLCIDAVFESSNFDVVGETIQSALTKPNPQIKSQTALFLYRVFFKCSADNVSLKHVKLFIPALIKLNGDPDPEVRDASSAALGSMMKSVGEKAMSTLLGDISSDKNKWEKIIEYKQKAEKDYTEWLASQPKLALPELSSSGNCANAPEEGSGDMNVNRIKKEVDPWKLLDPVDVTKSLTKSFFEEVQSKKWQERKEALDHLLSLLTENPRLSPDMPYLDVVNMLKGIIKSDSNINVVALAVKCITNFATGLRTLFQTCAISFVPIIFERFKEKKSILKDPLIECIDALYLTTYLEPFQEHIEVALTNKNPAVKIQTCLFLYRVFKNLGPTTVPKKQAKIQGVCVKSSTLKIVIS